MPVAVAAPGIEAAVVARFTDGIEDDEALVFMIVDEDGEQYLEIADDIDIVDAVFEEYYTMLAEEGII
jgi:hypothetical protein